MAASTRQAYTSARGALIHVRLLVAFAVMLSLCGAESAQRLPDPDFARQVFEVAWVDFDVDAARKIYASFASKLSALSLERGLPVVPRFVGADVANGARLSAEMRKLVASRPAIIVATSAAVAQAVHDTGSAIPVYFIIQSDPVREGLIEADDSSRTLTGYTFFVPLDVKAMEIIKRVFVKCRNVGVIADGYWLQGSNMSKNFFAQSKAMDLNLMVFNLETERDIEALLQDPRAARVDVWYVPYGQLAFDFGPTLGRVLSRSATPTVYARRKFLGFGGLLAIQAIDPDAVEEWSKAILEMVKGVPANHIPIMRPKEVEVSVSANRVTAFDRQTRERIAREANVFE